MNTAKENSRTGALPRKVEVLALLQSAAPDSVPLQDLVATSGRSDRNAQASTMGTLLRLRNLKFVEYVPPAPGSPNRGRTYRITREGSEWFLHNIRATTGMPPAESVLETGAMRGERPTVLICDARQVRATLPLQPCWVFGLAHLNQGLPTQ